MRYTFERISEIVALLICIQFANISDSPMSSTKIILGSGNDSDTLSVDNTMMYNTSTEHLLDELNKIDLMIRYQLKKFRTDLPECMDGLQGLYISEDEVNAILRTPICGAGSGGPDNFPDPELEYIEKIADEIKQKKENSLKNGTKLRLHVLSEIFNLQPFEINVLLICIAPELDLKYEKIYSYLQNDVTKKRPGIDLVTGLLIHSAEERLKGREYFSQTSPLIKNRLIHLTEGESDIQHSFLSKFISIDERVMDYLLGSDEITPDTRNLCKLIEPERSPSNLIMTDSEKRIITGLIEHQPYLKEPMIFYFHGAYGTGKKTTADIFCRGYGKSLLVVDAGALIGKGSLETLIIVMREAMLQNSFLFFEGFDILLKQEVQGIPFNVLFDELDNFRGWVFLSGKDTWEPKSIFTKHRFVSYAFSIPDYSVRKQLWESFLGSTNMNYSADVDVNTLAAKFGLSGGQIKDAIFSAGNIAMLKDSGRSEISMSDIYQGCKAQSNQKLGTMAKKIDPHYAWDDIILPSDTREQLKEISGHIEYKEIVYHEWGFESKLSLGKGVNIFFSGPSGTGKTMAAEIIAKEVGLDLYKIDLSSIVSKYIGETEKNLNKIFKEAQTSNAILFFDEADALFGKRSEVKDSHDRYANIETNYLLQKMEEHEGTVILASNFKKNIDDAFLRRLNFTVDFPFPDEKIREQIWRNIFPEKAPTGDDIDYSFLADLKITGGNIKNIALSAAFLAAGTSLVITMAHVAKAVKREFQKMGKLCTPDEFGKYYEIVK